MKTKEKRLVTIGQIAKRWGCEVHQVEYVLRSRRLKPAARAGVARVFSEAQAVAIAAELMKIKQGRRGDISRG
jgi:hypothetical protein